jgi:molecular chaperone GrpE (heat shock protein)
MDAFDADADERTVGTVAREVRRGWRLGDELLRPAQVVVATPPEAAGPWR